MLFLLDPADEVVFLALQQFQGKNLVSVEKWAKDEAKANDDKAEKSNDFISAFENRVNEYELT